MAEAKPAAAAAATSPAPAAAPASPALAKADGLSEAELQKKVGKLWADDDPEDDSPAPTLLDKAKVTEAPEQPESEDVVIDQKNPNSPLYSVKSFAEMGLPEELLKGVYAMKFTRPSKIQEAALPIVLGNPSKGIKPQNLIAQAQSGTGKTTVFTLAMLNKVNPAEAFPQAVCICPTRELARQIFDVVKQMGQFTQVKLQLVVPDADVPSGKITSHILIGTPGRFGDLTKKDQINMKKVKMFVLDEADVMLDMQGLADSTTRLQKMCPADCQILLFSATYKPAIAKFAEQVVPQPHSNIRLSRKELTLENIQQLYIDCGSDARRFEALTKIYEHISVGQSIVFLHRRDSAKQLAMNMKKEGHMVSLISGDLSPADRDAVIDDYRKGKSKVLISTNVLARGIDVLQVSLVINYDLPMTRTGAIDVETYLHRIGRTGRWSRQGIAINFVHDAKTRADLKELETFFGTHIKELKTEQIPDLDRMLKALKTISRPI